jgi:hypothetical protein
MEPELASTMAPPPLASMARAQACAMRKEPVTFTPSVRWNSAASSSRHVLVEWIAAMWMSPSSPPNARTASATAASQAPASATSARAAKKRRRASPATPVASGSLMSTAQTLQPLSSAARTHAAPMPLAAPVTMIRFTDDVMAFLPPPVSGVETRSVKPFNRRR